MKRLFPEFVRELSKRLEYGVHTTEDAVRYTFFHALCTAGGLQPHQIVLEFPHDALDRKALDILIPEWQGKPCIIEFKYHRRAPGKNSSAPRPMKAGSFFKDLMRLARFRASETSSRLLIYVTDGEMASYLSNPRNRLHDVFNLACENQIDIEASYLDGYPETLLRTCGEVVPHKLTCVFSEPLPNDHHLRVYSVSPFAA